MPSTTSGFTGFWLEGACERGVCMSLSVCVCVSLCVRLSLSLSLSLSLPASRPPYLPLACSWCKSRHARTFPRLVFSPPGWLRRGMCCFNLGLPKSEPGSFCPLDEQVQSHDESIHRIGVLPTRRSLEPQNRRICLLESKEPFKIITEVWPMMIDSALNFPTLLHDGGAVRDGNPNAFSACVMLTRMFLRETSSLPPPPPVTTSRPAYTCKAQHE